jgi:hypothetical protein
LQLTDTAGLGGIITLGSSVALLNNFGICTTIDLTKLYQEDTILGVFRIVTVCTNTWHIAAFNGGTSFSVVKGTTTQMICQATDYPMLAATSHANVFVGYLVAEVVTGTPKLQTVGPYS